MRRDNSICTLELMAEAADQISTGDILNKKIRSEM